MKGAAMKKRDDKGIWQCKYAMQEKEYKKFLKQCDQDINTPLIQNYFNKKANNLYEYFLMMYYFYLCFDLKRKHYIDTVGKKGEVIRSKEFKIKFPVKYNSKARTFIKPIADFDFERETRKQIKLIAEAAAKRKAKKPFYFPDDPIKEYAQFYLWNNTFPKRREDNDMKDSYSFRVCAYECRFLSIIYENFNLFQKKLYRPTWDLFYELETSLTHDVIAECHELIGYWEIKAPNIRAAKHGGSAEKYLKGIYLAIQEALKERPKASAAFLWNYFKIKHGTENALVVNGYNVYYYDDLIWQEEESEEPKSRTLRTFRKYVSDAKKTAKQTHLK
jgi:hypothetical protein